MKCCLKLLPVLLLAAPLTAQIGHDPDASPYHDIMPGTTLEAYVGSVMGSGGPIPVGPRDGPMIGARVLLRAKNTISLGFGIWGAATERTILSPTVTPAEREVAVVDHGLLGAEALIRFNLTGGKSWRGVAPYVGIGLGIVKASDSEADDSGYDFGTKFNFAPVIGTRVFLGRKFYLNAEAKGLVWKLDYPTSFSLEPTNDPGTEADPHAINPTGRTGQYILTPSLVLGIGWSF